MDRVIKVTMLGELKDCENDQISIAFSPRELTNLIYLFRTRAKEAENYSDRDNERKLLEAFSIAREMWEKARKEKDK